VRVCDVLSYCQVYSTCINTANYGKQPLLVHYAYVQFSPKISLKALKDFALLVANNHLNLVEVSRYIPKYLAEVARVIADHNTRTVVFIRLDALALSVIATATWLGGWVAGWVAGCLSQPVLYQND